MDKLLVRSISFISYIGFYIGIVLMLSFNLDSLTRFYSIPIRILTCILMFIFVIVYSKKTVTEFKFRLIYLFWFVYILQVFISINNNTDFFYSKSSLEFGLYTIIYCIMPFYFFKSVDLKKYNNIIVESFILAGFVLSLVSIYFYKDIILSGNIGRLNQAQYSGFEIKTINPLILAYSATLTIGLIFYKFGKGKFDKKWTIYYYLFCLLLAFILLLIGSSRGAFLGLIASVIVLLIYGNSVIRKRILIIFSCSIPVIIWLLIKIGSSLFDRVNGLNNVSEDNSANTRIKYWNDSLNEFYNNPLIGSKLEMNYIYPHNIFIEILMSTGFIGIVSFGLFIFFVIKRIMYITKRNNEYLWIFIFFVQALIHYNFTESIYLANALFISTGLILSIDRRNI